ncbi:MAG: tetratricopeptide (TPR) repeat protein, partial [Lysobacterales bacterium]
MTKITLILLILLITGCTTAERHTFINPSEYLYHKGNNHYEAKEFNQAIDKYQEFLKGNERSSLAIPAQLNLGMSYYYSGDYVNAYTMLSKTTLKDPNLKKYTNSIIEECRSYAGDEIANLTQATPTTKETKKDPAETISITITDAFINNFGSLVVTGQTNMPTTIFVDNKSATADSKNKFTIS